MAETVPVSVVVPTVGREQLAVCLQSLAGCEPPPAEIVVVDQSGSDAVAEIIASFPRARRVSCHGRGVSCGTNLGLREAAHETVLVTHDDCAVASSWAL